MNNGTFGALLNPASQVSVKPVTAQNGVAAGAGDNTELTSLTIDTKPTGLGSPAAGVLAVGYKTTLTAAATLKITVKIQESADDSNWDAAETLVAAETLQTGVQTALNAAYELGIDLSKRKRYVRFLLTMDLSAGATDTFVYGAALIATGYDRTPIT